MYLLSLAIAPGFAIMLFIYLKDRYNREPLRHLFMCFVLGVLSAIPAVYLEMYGSYLLNDMMSVSLTHTIISAFIVVALVEEFCKYIMLSLYAYPKKAFDEPLDGIVYSVMVSMGFATIENVGYVFQHGMGTGIARMFLSVPAHAAFGVLMGYYVGQAKFVTGNGFRLRMTGLFWAVFFHGLFDCFLFLGDNGSISKYVSGSFLVAAAFISYIFAVRLSLKALRKHQLLSKQHHERNKFPIV